MKTKFIVPLLLFVISCSKDPVIPDISTGLIFFAALDGNTKDSVSGNNGNNHLAVPSPDRHGIPARSMQFFSEDSSTISFGDLSTCSFPNNQFTICCWILVTDTNAAIAVLSKRNAFGPWEYSLDNHFNHAVFNLDNWVQDGSTTVYGVDPLNASAGFQVNEWQHIAFVADGSDLKAYLGGELQAGSDSYKPGFAFTDTDASFVIGNGGGYGKNLYFNGCIDEVRLYNMALDAEAIQYIAGL